VGGGAGVTSATAAGSWRCLVAGATQFKAEVTAYTSGTITVHGLALQASTGSDAGAVRYPFLTALASGVTTNTTSSAVAGVEGWKSIYGQVVCSSGTCVQTQAIYGDIDSDAANGVLLCTLTLSGTTRAQDACPVITANFSYLYVVTTATSGTSATGAVYAMY
jgi:hypothetical protein